MPKTGFAVNSDPKTSCWLSFPPGTFSEFKVLLAPGKDSSAAKTYKVATDFQKYLDMKAVGAEQDVNHVYNNIPKDQQYQN